MSEASRRNPGNKSPSRTPADGHVVLILSSDPVAAALLGALIETLGYRVRFYQPEESPDDVIRRQRPHVAMVDCDDTTVMNDEVLGRARMRGLSVIIFGTAEALQQVRQAASEQWFQTLLLPATLDEIQGTLERAIR